MKILPVLLPLDGGTPGARTGAEVAMQWRRALEQAQWQARPHASAGGEARPGARDARADGAGTDGSPRASRAGSSDEQAAAADRARPASRGDAVAEPVADALEKAFARQGTAHDARATAPTTAGAPAAVSASGAPAPRVEAPAPRAALSWAELPEWPEVVFHASASGGRVSVGVRDADLTDADALALYVRLRSRLAQAGLELAGLTVNGHAVTPDESHRDHA